MYECVSVFLCDQQEKVQIRKELWRIEDVIAGLSTSKANYKVTISSVTNPGETPRAFMCTKQKIFSVCAIQYKPHGHASVSLTIEALNHILDTNALNISHGKRNHCLYSVCVFMLHVHIHRIPQRGNLCLQCRRHQCLLCLGARLLWRWDCPSSSSSTAPTSAPIATPPPFPPVPASSPYTTGWTQPSSVGLNGWVTPATSLYEKHKVLCRAVCVALLTKLVTLFIRHLRLCDQLGLVENITWLFTFGSVFPFTPFFSTSFKGLQLSIIFIIN